MVDGGERNRWRREGREREKETYRDRKIETDIQTHRQTQTMPTLGL